MLNLKNNENYDVFDEICKTKAKIKIKFQKMKCTFLDSIPWSKNHQPPLLYMVYSGLRAHLQEFTLKFLLFVKPTQEFVFFKF